MKCRIVTIHLKATEQYFSVVPFTMLYNVVPPFESVDEMLFWTIHLKATEQYFPVILFTMLFKVVLAFESVDVMLYCDHSNESY